VGIDLDPVAALPAQQLVTGLSTDFPRMSHNAMSIALNAALMTEPWKCVSRVTA